MADRVFTALLIAISGVYAWIAFTAIKAPFQYDPLGPESWPRILVCVMLPCLAWIFIKPDTFGLDTDKRSLLRLAATLALLLIYTELYEPAGFVLATFGFAAVMSRLLGASIGKAVAFGVLAGIVGYLVGAGLLGLNLPAGPLPKL